MRSFFFKKTYFTSTALLLGILLLAPFAAHADIANWQRGADVYPRSNTDFGSDSFKQSMQNLKAAGANSVALVVPLYQSTIYSTDVAAGWNTPTDDSLAGGIDYARSIGLNVTIKVHVDSYDGNWRANINPQDRTGWFANYGKLLVHVAQIAQAHHASMIVIGTELVSMASSQANPTNTSNWQNLISQVRAVFSGKLTYGANSNDNSNDQFQDEKKYIGFWGNLDYVGLSAYYTLNGDGSVQSLESAWDSWNKGGLQQLSQSTGKPIIITEVGYRSIDNAAYNPWDYGRGSGVNQRAQANAYEALIRYWNDYSYFGGVYFWDWSTDPNAGGNDTDYTPQHKTAQQVMTSLFMSPPAANGSSSAGSSSSSQAPATSAAFSASATPSSNPTANAGVSIQASVSDLGNSAQNVLVDVEVYDQNNQKAFQQFFQNQSFQKGQSQNYAAQWTPKNAGSYKVAVGIFANDWSQNYFWASQAGNVTVASQSAPSQPAPAQAASSTQSASSQSAAASAPSASQNGSSNQTSASSPPAPAPKAGKTDVWWPADGSHVSGAQPFKAMTENLDVSQYDMFWQVDGGQLVPMSDNSADYPHKEFAADLSGWNWKGAGPYKITFVSKDHSGAVISQQSVNVYTQ